MIRFLAFRMQLLARCGKHVQNIINRHDDCLWLINFDVVMGVWNNAVGSARRRRSGLFMQSQQHILPFFR